VHSDGFVTLYAHNSVNFVHAGERVTRGQVLAEVGSTGRSKGPHVHFELIHESSNCDPAPLFRPGVKQRSGKLARIKYTAWRRADKKPSEVRCSRRQRHPSAQWVINENPDKQASSVEEDHSAPDPEREPPPEEEE
jgi:murein DD-endopeptidase MepM/ murein hydrolase activator NlpD